VVGHTDDTSTRIWIQVSDDPRRYWLRVEGVGRFQFESTELGAPEFGTAIARVTGLSPDLRYRYRVVRAGRFVPGASGSFRTLPPRSSFTNLLFCAISCNGAEQDGAWQKFADFVEASQPSFVVMMGDQIYMDEDRPDVFEQHFDADPATRRKAMAEKYRLNWSRDAVRRVLANVPTYMVWDDHDIRDGWGSLASQVDCVLRGCARRLLALPRLPQPTSRRLLGPATTRATRPDPAELHRRPDPARAAPGYAVRLPLRALDGAGARQPRRS
jgi:hypothetical protein